MVYLWGRSSITPVDAHVWMISAGFFGVFAAYACAELLQTTINGSSGYICLFTVYGCFVISASSAPWFVKRFSARRLMWLSSIAYVFVTASYLFPGSRSFLTFSCAWVGFSASVLWNSQGVYVGACATEMSKRTGKPHTECTSAINGIFFAVESLSGCVSNFLAAAVLWNNGANAVSTLFLVLTIVGILGVVALALLPEASSDHWFDYSNFKCSEGHRNSGTPLGAADVLAAECEDGGKIAPSVVPSETLNPLSTLKFLLTNKNIILMAPMIAAQGARACFLYGVFTQLIISRWLGKFAVGIIGGVLGIVSTLALLGWSKLAQLEWFGRRTAFAIGICMEILWLSGFFFLVWAGKIPSGGILPTGEVATPMDWVCVLAAVMWVSVSGIVFNAFTRATMQAQFKADQQDVSRAMSGSSFYASLGYTLQAAFSLYMDGRLDVQLGVLIVGFMVGAVGLWYLHTKVCSIDPMDKLEIERLQPERFQEVSFSQGIGATAEPSGGDDGHDAVDLEKCNETIKHIEEKVSALKAVTVAEADCQEGDSGKRAGGDE